MTAAGDQVLAYAYTWVGTTEDPPNSNICHPFTDAWGAGAWCAMAVSYWNAGANYPLPPINGPAGFSYCPDGQVAAYTTGHAVGAEGVQPGDSLIMSWEPWHMEGGVAICSYGVYAGSPAGDHTGLFVRWLSDSYMVTLEGNTSQSSWDDGGAVLERTDRHTGQMCCYARHEALMDGPIDGEGDMTPEERQMLTAVFNAVFAQAPGELGRQIWATSVADLPANEGSAADMMRDASPGNIARQVWAERIDTLPTEDGAAADMIRDLHSRP